MKGSEIVPRIRRTIDGVTHLFTGVLPRNYLEPFADDLFKELGVPVSTTLGATSWSGVMDRWSGVMDRRPQLMWEHEGQCQCGKTTYLAGQCRKCALEDAAERHDHAERKAAQDADAAVGDYEIAVPPPGSLLKETAASEPGEVAAWLETEKG